MKKKTVTMTEKQARQDLKSLRSKFQHIVKYYPLSDKEILEDQVQDIFKDLEKISIIGEEQEKTYSKKELLDFAQNYCRMVIEKGIYTNCHKTLHNTNWIKQNL